MAKKKTNKWAETFGIITILAVVGLGGAVVRDVLGPKDVVHTWSSKPTVGDIYHALSDSCWIIQNDSVVGTTMATKFYVSASTKYTDMLVVVGKDGAPAQRWKIATTTYDVGIDSNVVVYPTRAEAEAQLCINLRAKADSLCGGNR